MAYRLPHDEVIMRVCNQYAESYKEAIKEEMEVVDRAAQNSAQRINGYEKYTPEEEGGRKRR